MEDADDIVREFLVESYENLDQLDQDLVALEKEPGARPLLSSVFRTIHTIKGTSGFLAFGNLEHVTHAGENLLVELRDGKRSMDQPTTDVLLAVVDRVREILRTIETGGDEGSVAIDDVVARVEAVLATDPAAAAATLDPEPVAVTTTGAEPVAAAEPVGEPAPVTTAVIVERIAETVPAPAPAAVVTPAPAPAPAAPAPATPAAAAAAPAPAVPTPRIPPSAATAETPDEGVRTISDSSIRVDVELLDGLMREVGELVLARNQITRLASVGADLDLSRAAQRLDVIAGELQEGVMKTRMQPIEHIWSKMPRVVRDLAASCGREVGLEMSGGDTELDRGLLEAVKDPLTHLVRNAIDHGIEPVADRVAAGKPAQGLLTLRAYHAGGLVVVEVSDDGRGIDAQKVAASALRKGLRTAEQLAAATPADLMQLLFLPGFSTAEQVTNVSGRGVGMDVVRTKIESVGGSVDVESKPGIGTTWRLRIPLTLAIMPALTVECGEERFAVPQVNLLELVAVDDRNATSIEYVHSAPVYRLRGDLLPLVSLAHVLDGTTQADGSAPVLSVAPGSSAVIAVVASDDVRFGLVVDRVLDTEEIVVKALSPRLKSIGTYSGATVLGDGRVALILDVQGLARRALVGEPESGLGRTRSTAAAAGASTARQVLVAGIGGGRRVAMPLASVTRLEQIPASLVELVGGREVVQYRGAILPLVRLDRLLGAMGGFDEETLQVVVHSQDGRGVGLVVESIVDILADDDSLHSDLDDMGLVGSAVLGGKVTELLDVRSAILAADPAFFDATTFDDAPHDRDLVGVAR
ncbi:chemotaxis protein CheA [Cellulomonas sp. NTE-D12]|uniref:chemotaxis protein CheA n=1 Tax=Cellulomonas sp. NTE-D12 TaxID=2962632 RepID=UPI003081381E|nr:ATPase [Cellulomonas sp. NTE-D12]